jgi:hypothetical protein
MVGVLQVEELQFMAPAPVSQVRMDTLCLVVKLLYLLGVVLYSAHSCCNAESRRIESWM